MMSREDLQSVHGVNERLSIENCARMVGFYIAYIKEIADLPAEVDFFAAEGEEPEAPPVDLASEKMDSVEGESDSDASEEVADDEA